MIAQRIPNLLRRYRKARGLNQNQAAGILGIESGDIISRWEKGKCLPSLLNALKLAALYRTMADPLFPNLTNIVRREVLRREQRLSKAGCVKASQ